MILDNAYGLWGRGAAFLLRQSSTRMAPSAMITVTGILESVGVSQFPGRLEYELRQILTSVT